MTEQPHFLLNVNDGVDTIHDPDHLTENCNSDQIEGRKHVDAATALAMVKSEQAVRCRHCSTEGDPS